MIPDAGYGARLCGATGHRVRTQRVPGGTAGGGGAKLPGADESALTEALESYPGLPLPRVTRLAYYTNVDGNQFRRSLNPPDPRVRASAHYASDFALTEQGDADSGADSRQEALRGFEAVGDRWGQAMVPLVIARDHSLRGDHAATIAACERAAALSSELGADGHLQWTKARLATERRSGGDLDGTLRGVSGARGTWPGNVAFGA